MPFPKTIIVQYVYQKIHKFDEGWLIQFSGLADRPMGKLMRLQTWTIAHDTKEEAERMKKEIEKALLVIVSPKVKRS